MSNGINEIIHAVVTVSKGHIGYGLEDEIRAKAIEALRLIDLRVAVTIYDRSKNIALLIVKGGAPLKIKYIEE